MNWWKVYERGGKYRVGRKRWWGMQWHKTWQWDYAEVYVASTAHVANLQAVKLNMKLAEEGRFARDRWKLVKE